MVNKLYERKAALEAALHTVNYQIKNLTPHYSREQVRCWRVHRRKLRIQLDFVNRWIKARETKSKALATFEPDSYLKSLIQKTRK